MKRLTRPKPLWTCPRCRRQFVTRNLWHSCGRYSLAQHFKGKDPVVRQLFNRFHALLRRCGPVEVIPQKTRIVFVTRIRFAAVMARSRWLEGHLLLGRRVPNSRFHRIETFGSRTYTHSFRLRDPAELDDRFTELLRESYARGRQEPRRHAAAG